MISSTFGYSFDYILNEISYQNLLMLMKSQSHLMTDSKEKATKPEKNKVLSMNELRNIPGIKFL